MLPSTEENVSIPRTGQDRTRQTPLMNSRPSQWRKLVTFNSIFKQKSTNFCFRVHLSIVLYIYYHGDCLDQIGSCLYLISVTRIFSKYKTYTNKNYTQHCSEMESRHTESDSNLFKKGGIIIILPFRRK